MSNEELQAIIDLERVGDWYDSDLLRLARRVAAAAAERAAKVAERVYTFTAASRATQSAIVAAIRKDQP